MRIIDEIKDKDLVFIEQDFDKDTFYEIYYLGSKIFQCKNKFEEALKTWTNSVKVIAYDKVYDYSKT